MDVKTMTTDALDKRASDVLEEIANIKTQLRAAKSDAAATGEYSDRQWFISANHALQMKGREHQMVIQELGARRKEERRAHNTSKTEAFVRAARRRLDPELFADLMREADEQA